MDHDSYIICTAKRRLVDEFVSAVHYYNALHTAQMRAVVAGKGFTYEQEIADAREERDRVKYALLADCDCADCSQSDADVRPESQTTASR